MDESYNMVLDEDDRLERMDESYNMVLDEDDRLERMDESYNMVLDEAERMFAYLLIKGLMQKALSLVQ
jgi:hypothetical protein